MAKGPTQQTRITIRTLACFYLLYLAYSLIKDWGEIPQNQRIGFGFAIAAFIVLPGFFLFTCWKDWKQMKAEQAEQEQAEQLQQAAMPEASPEPEESEADERERIALAERLAQEGRVEELEQLLNEAPASAPAPEEQEPPRGE